MKTIDLIEALARGAGPAPRRAAARRLLPAGLVGTAISLSIVTAWIGQSPLDHQPAASLAMKFAYAGAFAIAAAWLAARLSRPAARATPAGVLLAVVFAAMAAFGLLSIRELPAADRIGHLLGYSWTVCPWAVLGLSLPGLAATLWAMRGLAPTRPRTGGWAAGLLAGACGALGYAVGCTEQAASFVAIWYTLGILLTGALGALIGPRVLRW